MGKVGIRQSLGIIIISLITLQLPLKSSSLTCFDGSRCEYHQCVECEGVACLRIIRSSSSDYYFSSSKTVTYGEEGEVAMTCLPADTRTYDLEPAGCRTNPINNIRTCVCYDRDYCNSTPASRTLHPSIVALSILTALLQTFLLR